MALCNKILDRTFISSRNSQCENDTRFCLPRQLLFCYILCNFCLPTSLHHVRALTEYLNRKGFLAFENSLCSSLCRYNMWKDSVNDFKVAFTWGKRRIAIPSLPLQRKLIKPKSSLWRRFAYSRDKYKCKWINPLSVGLVVTTDLKPIAIVSPIPAFCNNTTIYINSYRSNSCNTLKLSLLFVSPFGNSYNYKTVTEFLKSYSTV